MLRRRLADGEARSESELTLFRAVNDELRQSVQEMCNLYTMTATVDEMRRLFGPFTGDTANLPPFDEIYPGYQSPVLRREGGGLKLEMMNWGFPGPLAAKGRPVTN